MKNIELNRSGFWAAPTAHSDDDDQSFPRTLFASASFNFFIAGPVAGTSCPHGSAPYVRHYGLLLRSAAKLRARALSAKASEPNFVVVSLNGYAAAVWLIFIFMETKVLVNWFWIHGRRTTYWHDVTCEPSYGSWGDLRRHKALRLLTKTP